MGYRLFVDNPETNETLFYGTKLYGYVDEEDLESLQYLFENFWKDDYPNDFTYRDVYLGYCASNETLLDADEFKKFLILYMRDLYKYYPSEIYGKIDLCIDELLATIDGKPKRIGWC